MTYGALFLLISMFAPQSESVARWTFDGDVKDSGPSALPTKSVGRLDFIESPISGKAAVFNGVDAFVQVDPAGKIGAGSEDFSLSAWILPLDRRPAPLFGRKRWSLAMIDGGALQLRIDKGVFSSPAGFFPAGQWNHVVMTVKRKPGGPEAALIVNGERFAVGSVPDVDLDPAGEPLLLGKAPEDGK